MDQINTRVQMVYGPNICMYAIFISYISEFLKLRGTNNICLTKFLNLGFSDTLITDELVTVSSNGSYLFFNNSCNIFKYPTTSHSFLKFLLIAVL